MSWFGVDSYLVCITEMVTLTGVQQAPRARSYSVIMYIHISVDFGTHTNRELEKVEEAQKNSLTITNKHIWKPTAFFLLQETFFFFKKKAADSYLRHVNEILGGEIL